MLTRQMSVNGTLVQTSLAGRLWRISAKCAISNCLNLGVHSSLNKASDRPITSPVANDTFSDEAKNTEPVTAWF
jgi:hypothetical protein